jgi:hypothetical protein
MTNLSYDPRRTSGTQLISLVGLFGLSGFPGLSGFSGLSSFSSLFSLFGPSEIGFTFHGINLFGFGTTSILWIGIELP